MRSRATRAPFLDSVFLSKSEKVLDDASSSTYVPVAESVWGDRLPGAEAACCAVPQGPPEGAVDHSLQKADAQEGGVCAGHGGRLEPREGLYLLL